MNFEEAVKEIYPNASEVQASMAVYIFSGDDEDFSLGFASNPPDAWHRAYGDLKALGHFQTDEESKQHPSDNIQF